MCGVAVREGNVVFQINRCFRVFGFRLVLAGWSFAWGSDFDASGWTLGVASTGRSISVSGRFWQTICCQNYVMTQSIMTL